MDIKIHADKLEFLTHLEQVAAGHGHAAKDMTGKEAKARQLGMAEGVRKAAELVRQWERPEPPKPPVDVTAAVLADGNGHQDYPQIGQEAQQPA